MNELAVKRSLNDSIAEYEYKKERIKDALSAFEQAGADVKNALCVNGVWGQENIDTGSIWESTAEKALLKSAWLNLYEGMNIKLLMSANDKRKFERHLSDIPPFTIENIRSVFGDYIVNPMGSILRGLAEVFCDLDPSFKSHDKMKIGVDGLPKRIIVTGFGEFSSYGRDKIQDVLNALGSYQGRSVLPYGKVYSFVDEARKNGQATLEGRGVTLKVFKNGNGHLFFDEPTLKDINKALSEYYGEVLPDCHEAKPEKRAASTAVSKDLQYYPTPKNVVSIIMKDITIKKGDRILEPSCGCGRILDAVAAEGAHGFGVEVDPARANIARSKGHSVHTENFLEMVPEPVFDRVIMNPPFYGTHYAKHVKHAMKFLKPGGILTTILPITARYDHKELDDLIANHSRKWSEPWRDLPVGSFKESGTNINTTILTLCNDMK